MTVGVVFEGIRIRFGDTAVLRGVSFAIKPGIRTALIGPNGGGKTTLARILLGLAAQDEGSVSFVDVAGRPLPRPRIGYLPQRPTLSPQAPVSGVDLVSLSLSPGAGLFVPAAVTEEARHALRRAGLPDEVVDRPVGRLSGGQRQRVLLARALAGSPPLLLLDEPDTALDADGLKTLRRIVAEEIRAGRTVVYVTHDSDAMGGADAIFRIDGVATEELVE